MNKLAKVPGYKEQKYKQNIAKLDDVKTVSQNRELMYGPGGAAEQTSEVKGKTPSTHARCVKCREFSELLFLCL